MLDSVLGGSEETAVSRSRFGSNGSGLNYSDTDPLDDGTSDEWEQPEMPGSTDYGDETFQDTVTTEDGGSPGGTGAGAAGRGGYSDSALGTPIDLTFEAVDDVTGGIEDVTDDAADALTPEWLEWLLDHQEEALIGLLVLVALAVTDGTVGTPGGS